MEAPLTDFALFVESGRCFCYVPLPFGPEKGNFTLTVPPVPNAVTTIDCVPQE
jgi:hypothetical protein